MWSPDSKAGLESRTRKPDSKISLVTDQGRKKLIESERLRGSLDKGFRRIISLLKGGSVFKVQEIR